MEDDVEALLDAAARLERRHVCIGFRDELWNEGLSDEAPHDNAEQDKPDLRLTIFKSDEAEGGYQVADVIR